MKTERIVILASLVLLLMLPITMQPVAAKQTSVSILDKWDGASTLYITVNVHGDLPNSIVIQLHSAFKTHGNGFEVFDIQRVTLVDVHGSDAEYTFTVPFQGSGSYKFVALVFDFRGHLIGKALLEPREGTAQ